MSCNTSGILRVDLDNQNPNEESIKRRRQASLIMKRFSWEESYINEEEKNILL